MFGRKAWSPPEKPTAPADSGVRWLPRQRADIEFAPTTPARKPASSAGAARNARRQEQRQMRSCAPVICRTVCAAPGYFDHRGTAQGRRGFQHLSDRFARLSYLPDLAPAVQSPAPGAFSLGPAAARSLFGAVKKRMGGGSPRGPHSHSGPPGKTPDEILKQSAPHPSFAAQMPPPPPGKAFGQFCPLNSMIRSRSTAAYSNSNILDASFIVPHGSAMREPFDFTQIRTPTFWTLPSLSHMAPPCGNPLISLKSSGVNPADFKALPSRAKRLTRLRRAPQCGAPEMKEATAALSIQ